jgi:hypothetical protein
LKAQLFDKAYEPIINQAIIIVDIQNLLCDIQKITSSEVTTKEV